MGKKKQKNSKFSVMHVTIKKWPKKLRLYVVPVLVLILVAAIPFNIVYHFNSNYAYVDGYFVNYLDFVVHIVDASVILLVAWTFGVERMWEDKRVRWLLAVVLGFGLVHVLIFRSPVVAYSTIRIILYMVGLIGTFFYFNREYEAGRILKFGRVPFHEVLFWVVIGGAALQSIIGVAQFLQNGMLGIDFLGESLVQVGGYNTSSVYLPGGLMLRAYGTFPHPNVLGGFLVCALLIAVSYLPSLSRVKRVVSYVLIAIVLAGIAVTFSRVAWLLAGVILIAGIINMARIFIKEKARYVYVALGVAMIIGGVWIMFGNDQVSSSVRERVVTQGVATDVSVIQRKELAERATDLIQKNPLVGVGMGNYISSLTDNPVISDNGIRVMQPAHNIFLLSLAEIGIIGLLCIGYVLVELFRSVRFTWVTALSILIILVVGLFDHYVWTLPQGLGLVFILLIWPR